MGNATVRVTCPECGYVIRLDHAVTTSTFDIETTVYEIDRSAIAMHTCLQDAE